jgi:two-component system, OmpR family, sensor histidine kinase KdpD
MAKVSNSKLAARGFTGLFLRILAVSATLAAMTYFYLHIIHVNATTIALSHLLAVLICAALWGLVESITASILAVLCFNFFFLPPVLTFTIADPENWAALFAFLATSIIASELSARAKRRTQEALERQSEMEKLYAVSRAILLIEPTQSVGNQMG